MCSFQQLIYNHTQYVMISVSVTTADYLCLDLINFNQYGQPIYQPKGC
jgi:hypothetical protein